MILDFSHIILGFESMHATVERAEKMVRIPPITEFKCPSFFYNQPFFFARALWPQLILLQVLEMKARTEVLEAELRKKTNIEDRVKATENNLQSFQANVESRFAANDQRCCTCRTPQCENCPRAVFAALCRIMFHRTQSSDGRAPSSPGMKDLPKTPKFGLKNSARAKSAARLPSNRLKTGSTTHVHLFAPNYKTFDITQSQSGGARAPGKRPRHINRARERTWHGAAGRVCLRAKVLHLIQRSDASTTRNSVGTVGGGPGACAQRVRFNLQFVFFLFNLLLGAV
jgi:hypothetical protein